MARTTRQSFNNRLRFYTMCHSLVCLILVGMGLIIYDFQSSQQRLAKEYSYRAERIANDFTRLSEQHFQDHLQSWLAKHTDVKALWIADAKDNILFSYNPSQESYQPGKSLDTRLIPDEQTFNYEFSLRENPAKVTITVGLEGIYFHVFQQLIFIFIVSLVVLFLTWILSFKLQKIVTRSIDMMIKTVDTIRLLKDYSIRLPAADDEFSKLSMAFNDMLSEISRHQKALKESESRLNLALWGSDEVMLDWDLVQDKWFFDESFETLLGYPKSDTPSTKARYYQLIHTQDLKNVNQQFQEHCAGKSPYFEVEHRLRHVDGHWVWILARAKVVDRTERGRATRMVGTFVDVSLRKIMDEKLQLFQKIFESTNEGVFVATPDLKIIEVNPAFSRITGFLRREALNHSLWTLNKDNPNKEQYQKVLQTLEQKGYWQGEVWEKRKNEEIYPQRLTMNKMVDEEQKVVNYVGVFSDITQDKKTEDELAYLTHYDSLTGLPNRTLFMAQLETSMSALAENEHLALIIIGLDNFKIINDSLGHVVGDALLQNVSKRLDHLTENKHALSRITGDEFSLVWQYHHDLDKIKSFCQSILTELSSIFIIDGHDIFLSASLGVSFCPQTAQKGSELLLQADTAMYHAKQAGGNCVRLFTPEMNVHVQKRQQMETQLRSALVNEEFFLLYQPKVLASTGEIIGAEALLRWRNKEVGLVSPMDFISLAEDIGVIIPIGKWVLRTACTQARLWQQMGFKDFKMAVNLSACQFKSQDLAADIARILWETHLEPEELELELTESILMENAERCVLMLKVLKSMGVSISIDDFGTGYSSLSYLRRFPIDTIKIDRSFVQNILHSTEDASIIEAIVAMAKGLNLATVAEGVEEAEQAEFLSKQVGVQYFQGFYFSKPISADALTQLLHEQVASQQRKQS